MILFTWGGFPQYAARCVGAFVNQSLEECVVIATRPSVPIKGMEGLCGCKVYWVNNNDNIKLSSLLGTIPTIMIAWGWSVPAFNLLRNQVKENGGHVLCCSDENYIFNIINLVKVIRFNIFFRSKYDAYFVPGNSGVKYMRFMGVSRNKILKGFYSADPSLFRDTKPILERPKRILFVGQMIKRKNILPFIKAFLSINENKRIGWELEICGSGVLERELIALGKENPSITVHPFVQPEQLASLYQDARVFVLPSLEEHWGVVVHEAALSGCFLLVSKEVGANEDFVVRENGRVFDAYSFNSMKRAIEEVLEMDDRALTLAEKKSLEMSKNASLGKFVEGINSFIEYVKVSS